MSLSSNLLYPDIYKSRFDNINIEYNNALRTKNMNDIINSFDNLVELNNENLNDIKKYKDQKDINTDLTHINNSLKEVEQYMDKYTEYDNKRNEQLKISIDKEEIIGIGADKLELAQSDIKKKYLVPLASSQNYIKTINNIILTIKTC